MLKIKNKKGELIAKLEDEDSQPEFIKKKKKKKKDESEIEFTIRLAKEGEFEEENGQAKDEEQTL